MKIEMAEQMMASYLKNIELCSTVQENWTPAPGLAKVVMDNLTRIETIINDVKTALPGVDFMKKNQPKQFLMQAEIDVVGIKEDENKERHVYLLDSAFHEDGLHYSHPVENVTKKLIRAALIGDLFFNGYIIHVQFVSPKVAHSLKKKIIECEKNVMDVMARYNPNIRFDLYLDEDLGPLVTDLVRIVDDVADNNDLFMRAIKMLRMFDLIKMPVVSGSTGAAAPAVVAVATKRNNKEIILNAVDKLVKDGKITSAMEALLTTSDYTQKTFLISAFPFLKKAEDVKGKYADRYYAQLVEINGTMYRVVSQWTIKSLPKFDEWVKTVG